MAKKFYFERISEFKNEPIGKNKIVFLGNSIMQGGGNWNIDTNQTILLIEVFQEIILLGF